MSYNGVLNSANVTAGYMDIATAWKMESEYLYGLTKMSNQYNHPCAMTYFVRELKRATWFTQIPVTLRSGEGLAAFGGTFSSTFAKAGDYILNTFLRVTLPAVTLLPGNQYGVNGRLRWCRKIMHNLIEDCNLVINDQRVARLDSFILDFVTQFSIKAGKQDGYSNMIGDTEDLTGSHGPTTALSATIPQKTLNLPLPFFYSLDSGLALPIAALSFNEVKLSYKLRDWSQLLILDNSGAAGAGTIARTVPLVGTDIAIAPVLKSISTWATYVLVSEAERARMAETTRDIIGEIHQEASQMPFNPIVNPTPVYEPKFTFAVRALYFAVRNKTFANEWSNYTTASPYNNGTSITYKPSGVAAPIDTITLNYDSTTRFSEIGWDYFSQVVPFFCTDVMPQEIGYGLYSYSLNLASRDPNGSTNFSRLNAVQVQPLPTAEAIAAANGTGLAGSGADFPQVFEFRSVANTYQAFRIANGQLSFPFV